MHEAFLNGGIDTAVSHLLKKEKTPSYYLAFSTGGTIVWNAAKKGLPVKSLYCISATRIRLDNDKPNVPFKLLYGDNDSNRPSEVWASNLGVEMEVQPNFGHTLYEDEKIIKQVCLSLLKEVTNITIPQQSLEKKVV